MTRVPIPVGSGRSLSAAVLAQYVAIFVLAAVAVLAVSDVAVDRLSASGREPALVLGTVAAGGHIPAAITAAERERERLAQERDAFERFVTRVESITVTVGSTDGGFTVPISTANSNGTGLCELRNAYRTTVMATDHYESEYGEGLYENMSIELSENVATATVDGKQFSYPLKRAVVRHAIVARARRESLLQTIDSELDLLQRARSKVQKIERNLDADPDLSTCSLTELFDYDRRLRHCEDRYEQMLRDRQRRIHSNSSVELDSEPLLFQTFLYEPLEVDFPVLATVMEQYELLDKRRRAVALEISSR